MIIGEIQHPPALLRHIKAAIERRREAAGWYLITAPKLFADEELH